DQVAAYITEARSADRERDLRFVEVALPHPLLRTGLVLVDTPGVGGLGSVHSATTIGALPMATSVLFVSDASQESSHPELAFLEAARQLCPNVTCALTKVDFYPEWRMIFELDRTLLSKAGVKADVLTLSSTM